MRFACFAGVCLGVVIASGPGLAQTADRPAQIRPAALPQAGPPPAQPRDEASPAAPAEISHEEMVKEQERRDREEEAERERDDQ